MEYSSWNHCNNDILIQICQYCNLDELIALLQVNKNTFRLLQKEARAWCNAEWTSNGFAQMESFPAAAAAAALQLGKVYCYYNNQLLLQHDELSFLLTHFKHVIEFDLEWSDGSLSSQLEDCALFDPQRNAFHNRLQKLVLRNCISCIEDMERLTPDHFPQLRHLHIQLPLCLTLERNFMQVFALLQQLQYLQLDHPYSFNTDICLQTPHFYAPIGRMIALKHFNTNFHITCTQLLHLSTNLPNCSFEVYWFEPHQFHTMNPNMLLVAQSIHSVRSGSITLHLQDNEHLDERLFQTLIQHGSGIVNSMIFGKSMGAQKWLLNDFNRCRALSAYANLQTLMIACSEPTRINIHCLRALKPLYKQLRVFQLSNIIVNARSLQELEQEIRQMPYLTNLDNLIALHWSR